MRTEPAFNAGVTTSLSPAKRPPVRKIPPERRRRKINFSLEPVWYRRLLWRLKEDSQFLRTTIQASFALLCGWIGVEFYLFARWGMSGGTASFVARPPGAEGFLPISALISLKYFLLTGIINAVHPSGLFILLAILAVSLLLKKAFCSWLCPIGTLSESLWMLGRKFFRRNLTLPRWLDSPLRSLKYIILGFFVWSVATMDVADLANFIYSPYNKVADIKMYLFFAGIGGVALWTIIGLMLLSIVVKNFWCRFLCPYGALLGVASVMSPLKITRTKSTCIDCKLCTKACPAGINVHEATCVRSDECTGCLACVEACPVKDTLAMKGGTRSRPVPGWAFGLLVTGVFVGITGLAVVAGHWQNGISQAEYQRRFGQIDSPVYSHFRGHVAPYGSDD
jgi:Pyruvate/2-oxoacid:ferredoxin oxidoreductase delta subunit